jgi:hypothetical protein
MNTEKANYSFAYFVKGRDDISDDFAIEDNVMRNLVYDSAITWDVVLRDFISFLSTVYGYDIGQQVQFESFNEKVDRIREENGFDSDWPFDGGDEYVEGETTA